MNQHTQSYYEVDGVKFHSKIAAAVYATTLKKPMTWDFNKALFSAYDWSKEPELSLDQLYDLRSRELREKYDYLILSYSGGSDSHNILMSFIRQGLHIDEIVVNHMTEAWQKFVILDPTVTSNLNTCAEYELQTVPRLKEIAKLIPKTKITTLDLSQHLFDSFTKFGDASWVYTRKEPLNPLNVTRFAYSYYKDVRKQFDKAKTLAIVVGIEKPRSVIKDDKFYIYFNDKGVNIAPIDDEFTDYTNSSLEFFYWSKDSINLLCKQAHVVKRWVEASPERMKIWDASNLTAKTWLLVQEPILKQILYSNWNESWFQTEKPVAGWNSEFDQWFIQGYKDHPAFKIWKAGIDFVAENAKDYVIYDENGVADNLKHFIQYHYVGNVNKHNY
jgi:hypothetical protein